MADIQFSHGMGAYGRGPTSDDGAPQGLGSIATFSNIAGAMVSMALIAGIGVWGYKLMVRDVSGIPIVRAAEGEMRVRPQVPGGQVARHQGLSVNAVTAEGSAAGPVDQVVLAPRDTDLDAEDQPVRRTEAPSAETRPADTTVEVPSQETPAQDLHSGAIDAVMAELSGGETPPGTDAGDVLAQAEATPVMRPRLRPQGAARVQSAAFVVDTPSAEVDAAAIPAGTRLAQLGAFDSAEVARREWARLEGRFGEYLDDKSRVVQRAQSGGRTFYRLRAMGFTDLADARRFCSAFKAEGVDCIPVASK